MKGTFSLLGVKSPLCSLKLSACNIQLFFKVFDQYIKGQNEQSEIDFLKVFNQLFETMRGLLIFAKEGEFDKMFIEENLIP
jgi:hypothetical protein